MDRSVEGGGDSASSSGEKEEADEEVEKLESPGQEEVEAEMRWEEETFSKGDVAKVEWDGG